jgi:hypothetical protein
MRILLRRYEVYVAEQRMVDVSDREGLASGFGVHRFARLTDHDG